MSDSGRETAPVAIVGAGIGGVCCGLYLLREGHSVVLIDRVAPGEGASFGNGSIITEEAVVPVQTPGIIGKVPGMLFDPLGPLSIRWRHRPKLAPWLLHFARASSRERVEEVSIALGSLLEGALDAYGPLLQMAGIQDMVKRSGWLSVYETQAGFRAFEPMLELQRRRGVAFQVLPAEEIRQLEPNLAPIFERGVYYPDVSHTVNNFRFVQELARAFAGLGGQIQRQTVIGFDQDAGRVKAVATEAGRIGCSAIVIAAGAWSKTLTTKLGSRPPLDTERGYHLTLPDPGVNPRIPIYSTERGFVCTPLEDGLRIAGTVELGGLEAAANWKRADVLYTNASRWFPGLDRRNGTRWMGFRPSMPDTLPVISRAPNHENAYFAFGHGHCGLSLAARTGELIAGLIAGRDPGLDLSPYRVDRF